MLTNFLISSWVVHSVRIFQFITQTNKVSSESDGWNPNYTNLKCQFLMFLPFVSKIHFSRVIYILYFYLSQNVVFKPFQKPSQLFFQIYPLPILFILNFNNRVIYILYRKLLGGRANQPECETLPFSDSRREEKEGEAFQTDV